MVDGSPLAPVIRFATPADIALIDELDSFSMSPTRHIHRDMEKYFGSVDPSTHERILIFLADVADVTAAKAELMLPPPESTYSTGYIKRVVVHPDYRQYGLARRLIQHIINYASVELRLTELDLHVWEENLPAIRLYESLGFQFQHRELYYRLPL
jgi:ribosomal protein S18 acetylase RimI-like enzyme